MIFASKSTTTALLRHSQTTTKAARTTTSCALFLQREIITNKLQQGSSCSYSNSARHSRAISSHRSNHNHNHNHNIFSRTSNSQFGRCRSSSTTACQMTIADTSLGSEEGALLLDGLDVYTGPAKEDDHPLTVYGIGNKPPKSDDHVLLMLHGRTWSSVPVFHLLGGQRNKAKGYESRSLMEALHDNKITVYSMDFRGFGGTPNDHSDSVEPNRCVEDVESVLNWLAARHHCSTPEKISLMGWSQGALVAQLAAQRDKPQFSRLILYGSIFDPLVRYPRESLFVRNKENTTAYNNTFDDAIEDFTIEGTIPPKAATYFAEAALLADPVKAQWKHLYQFNNCDPARVHVPTLVVSYNYFVCLCLVE
jgi:pimeloyl-ACP methyl ester carboxylesterase